MAERAELETPFTVSGKTAVVTGAGSGLNLAFAELLLSRNCNVVFADLALRPEARDLVSQYTARQKSPRALFVETDVTSWPALSRLFDVALAEFGDFHILCPGAGVFEPAWSSFWRPPGSKESMDAMEGGHYATMDINLTHPIRATQMAISHWLYPRPTLDSNFPTIAKVTPSNPKRIIHVASVASQVPVFRAPLYAASKFAISGFVRSLGALDAYGIRVNAVAPGLVRTPLWTENPDKLANIDESKDTWVTPKEVAEAMLSCIVNEDKVGGTVLEVGAGHTRQVAVLNDPGPSRHPEAGFTTSNGEVGDAEVRGLLEDGTTWASHTQ